MNVRTRFAPSPTGYMHIGGMRTALFNWLFARRHGGQFILRIDDTDQQRNVESALGPILEAFRWLGLDWDEGPEVGGPHGPYFQSQRQSHYAKALEQLLSAGHAYRDFETPAETKQQREAAEKQKTNYVSSRQSLELSSAQISDNIGQGTPHVVRFLVPRDQKVVLNDQVRGEVEWDCSLMPDPVIARNDGSPLYNFATVVDDAALQITHVIRAEEHLSNAPIQVLLHRALGNAEPEWAHIPCVAAPGGKQKLSKRKIAAYRNNPLFRKLFELGDDVLSRLGLDPKTDALSPVMVEYYQRVGFLPEGVLNALFRLGWSLDDHTEFLSLDTVKNTFSLDRVIKSPAGLDPDKLINFQSHWMSELTDDQKLSGCLGFLIAAGWISDPPNPAETSLCRDVMSLAGDRIRVFGDILQFDEFFLPDDKVRRDDKALQKRLNAADEICVALGAFAAQMETIENFNTESLHDLLNQIAETRSLKPGKLFPAVRLCVTGKKQGPDLFQSLALCGRECCVRRIQSALKQFAPDVDGHTA
jgi:glutamyl-tRNA synthetase